VGSSEGGANSDAKRTKERGGRGWEMEKIQQAVRGFCIGKPEETRKAELEIP
jgi:hypothetical protein